MIINYKGLVEKEIGGKVIVFKFNMGAITLLNDLQNVNMAEFTKQIMNPKFSTLANFLFAGAETAYLEDGKNCNERGVRTFSQKDGAEWLNEIETGQAGQLFIDAFSVPETKNSAPVESTGN